MSKCFEIQQYTSKKYNHKVEKMGQRRSHKGNQFYELNNENDIAKLWDVGKQMMLRWKLKS